MFRVHAGSWCTDYGTAATRGGGTLATSLRIHLLSLPFHPPLSGCSCFRGPPSGVFVSPGPFPTPPVIFSTLPKSHQNIPVCSARWAHLTSAVSLCLDLFLELYGSLGPRPGGRGRVKAGPGEVGTHVGLRGLRGLHCGQGLWLLWPIHEPTLGNSPVLPPSAAGCSSFCPNDTRVLGVFLSLRKLWDALIY